MDSDKGIEHFEAYLGAITKSPNLTIEKRGRMEIQEVIRGVGLSLPDTNYQYMTFRNKSRGWTALAVNIGTTVDFIRFLRLAEILIRNGQRYSGFYYTTGSPLAAALALEIVIRKNNPVGMPLSLPIRRSESNKDHLDEVEQCLMNYYCGIYPELMRTPHHNDHLTGVVDACYVINIIDETPVSGLCG